MPCIHAQKYKNIIVVVEQLYLTDLPFNLYLTSIKTKTDVQIMRNKKQRA